MVNIFYLKFRVEFLLLYILILKFSAPNCSADGFSVNKNPHQTDLRIVNLFSGCSIHVINFPGFDIIFPIEKQPIVLLRYVSASDELYF